MLSGYVIGRDFEQRRIDRLLLGLCRNGLPATLTLQVRLSESPEAVIALALRRLVELSYTPSPLAGEMARALLQSQQPDGSFDTDPLSTAAVICALGALLGAVGGRAGTTQQQELEHGRSQALFALAAMQCDDGLFDFELDRTEQDRALVAAFILYLLGGDQAFRQIVRFADLSRWFEQNQDELDQATFELWQLSSTAADARIRRSAA